MLRELPAFEADGSASGQQGEAEEESNVNVGSKLKQKAFLPQEFHKAKRTVNKIVLQYFTHLRDEVQRGGKLFLNRSRIDAIPTAITHYVGLRYHDKPEKLEFKVKQEEGKRRELGGLFSYLAESEKIINYSTDGRVNVISLEKGDFKLPELATPVPFQNSIYLLDPCAYETKRKAFVPIGPALRLASDGKLKEIPGTLIRRSKCAIVRDKEHIYLLGGYASQEKILTNRCERYHPLSLTSEEIAPMIYLHHCPSACFLGKQLWVFSAAGVEFFDGREWVGVEVGWGVTFLPFQYLIPLSEEEVLILGGMQASQKSEEVRLFNTRERTMINYGPLLPQGVCNERSWGPCVVQGCVAVMSSIQASVYPQVGVKSSMVEVVYVHESSAYLNCILTV